jgi:hypothetical protein
MNGLERSSARSRCCCGSGRDKEEDEYIAATIGRMEERRRSEAENRQPAPMAPMEQVSPSRPSASAPPEERRALSTERAGVADE